MLGKLKKCGRKSAAAGLILFWPALRRDFSFLDYYFLERISFGDFWDPLYLERRGVRSKTN